MPQELSFAHLLSAIRVALVCWAVERRAPRPKSPPPPAAAAAGPADAAGDARADEDDVEDDASDASGPGPSRKRSVRTPKAPIAVYATPDSSWATSKPATKKKARVAEASAKEARALVSKFRAEVKKVQQLAGDEKRELAALRAMTKRMLACIPEHLAETGEEHLLSG